MKKKSIKSMIVIASIGCVMSGAIGGITATYKSVAEGEPATVQTLAGFECAGASVRVDEIGTRFQFNLSGDALAKQDLTAGVVYMPYDLYRGDLNAFVKGQPKALTTTFKWENNATTAEDTTDLVGYTYLSAKVIPPKMYNRMLVVRGYIEDGANVYYTDTIKTSMAYSAWQGTLNGGFTPEQKETLKTYMGPYTLTYGVGENEKIDNLYYGDTFYQNLPATMGGYPVQGWYWDKAKTKAIAAEDYATGTMSVYYKWEEFTVSGTVSCADSVDLTTVKIAVDGVDTGATVDASGAYSLSVEPGTHDFVFRTDGYVAFKSSVDVTEATALGDIALSADTFEIGNYKNFTIGADKDVAVKGAADALSGTLSDVTGGRYDYTMPNTATTGAFEFSAKMTAVSRTADEANFGIAVSNGTERLAFAFRKWGQIIVSSSTGIGEGVASGYYSNTTYDTNVTVKIRRINDKIELYRENTLMLTVTKDGITPGAAKANTNVRPDNLTSETKELAKYFGAEKELCVGVSSVSAVAGTMTYQLSLVKYVNLTGTISAAEGVTLANTTLKVDGFDTPISVKADGTYTASVPEGTHTLMFANGVRVATKEVTLGNGSNTVNVTLVDGTWAAGSYGKITSNNTPALNESGTYTIEGTNQLVVFPNTATSAPFTYEAAISNVTRTQPKTEIGISLTDGNYKLTVGYRAKKDTAQTAFSIGIATVAAQADHAVYLTNDDFGEEVTLKFVVTKESIEFYLNTTLIFTLTSNSFVSKVGNPAWTSGNLINVDNSVKDAYKTRIAGFFAENAKIAVGLNSGLSTGSATATYQCSITKN